MDDHPTWVIPGNLTIYDVKSYEQQCPLLEQPNSIWRLSMQATQEIDSAGIQWLLSLLRRLEASGGGLRLIDVSENILPVFALMGLNRTLSLNDAYPDIS
ncbi:hypothetical protein BFW38_06705 [Terasakiispira papahanaumokuakeensis]|uniref:STAS domain-containing protein n=1 Tax=Terasakiispira papahanaumokuakeensis TaxID=197479 RepID=A0A1E2V8E7_9GAMM|nr:STAS domain-containing protein [Terasakiispira papahanaumokuakeensis]ODC03280.1 hypothetical protein BFW38_06705 [Terasakiispira papahanaumokuakeensis]